MVVEWSGKCVSCMLNGEPYEYGGVPQGVAQDDGGQAAGEEAV